MLDAEDHIKQIVRDDLISIDLLRYENQDPTYFDLSCLTLIEKERFETMISDKRKREFYYTRILWKVNHLPGDIFYSDLGQPLLSNGHISISHSGEIVILGTSDTHSIGIDVEIKQDKILRVASKFLNQNEIKRFGMTDLEALTRIWSIKEALFKLHPEEHLNFAEQIEIIDLGSNPICIVKLGNRTYEQPFRIIDLGDAVITYCVEQKEE